LATVAVSSATVTGCLSASRTTSASSTASVRVSRLSQARLTDAGLAERDASTLESGGGGVARSGRAASSRASDASSRSRSQSTRVVPDTSPRYTRYSERESAGWRRTNVAKADRNDRVDPHYHPVIANGEHPVTEITAA